MFLPLQYANFSQSCSHNFHFSTFRVLKSPFSANNYAEAQGQPSQNASESESPLSVHVFTLRSDYRNKLIMSLNGSWDFIEDEDPCDAWGVPIPQRQKRRRKICLCEQYTGMSLMELPAEVRMNIIGFVFDLGFFEIGGSITGSYAPTLKSISVPEIWVSLKGLMMTCRQLRSECLDGLGLRSIWKFGFTSQTFLPARMTTEGRGPWKFGFRNRFGDFIWEMPRLMGPEFLFPMRLFELDMHSSYHRQYRKRFPVLLSVLCDHMPNLVSFRFKTSHYIEASSVNPRRTRDTANITRNQQNRRTLSRFASFLVHRHQNLDLIKFGETTKWGLRVFASVNIMSRQLAARPLRQSPACRAHLEAQPENLVLNATKIRRFLWAELAHVNIATLTLPDDSRTSEIDEGHSHFSVVDLQAYRTRKQRTAWGFRNFSADDLIGFCKARMTGNMDAKSTAFWNSTEDLAKEGLAPKPQLRYSEMGPNWEPSDPAYENNPHRGVAIYLRIQDVDLPNVQFPQMESDPPVPLRTQDT
ncbi:hypothetical protein PV10_02469 [Exophiala mesophila]|uniref:F-box domain-containing protein n=1 Tax=Exophiala mesophila TaxID=212818 RepID=A0A0D1Y2C2_EXOME|nr:uncharacterized protein PV10_02469 [Exophiala mesophila]KIV94731.1 hypothetical protein PV10_02469 [Exophiala mesophila]